MTVFAVRNAPTLRTIKTSPNSLCRKLLSEEDHVSSSRPDGSRDGRQAGDVAAVSGRKEPQPTPPSSYGGLMILVVGATGVLGQRTVRLLLAEGHRVRAMTRAAERAANLQRQGAEVVIGDLIDPPSLATACRGVSRVFAAAHGFLGRGRYPSEAVDDAGHRALIDAARAEGVKRFVYTSAFGASPNHPIDFYRTKYRIEQYLQVSGLDYVILRPSAFMEWHAHTFNGKGLIEKGRTQLLGSGTKPRNFVATSDVAHFAVSALTSPDIQQRILDIGGPGNFSNNEVAALYARTLGIEPRVGHLPALLVGFLAKVARPFHPGLGRLMQLSSLPDDAFPESFDATRLTQVARDHAFQLTSLEDFVREQVAQARRRADSPGERT